MKSENKKFFLCQILKVASIITFSLTLSTQALGQQYPEKPIRLIVPFVAGGTPDFIVRSMEPTLSSQLGQRVVVDNRSGAGGLVGTEIAAKSDPDGYTLIVGGTANFCVTPAVQKNNKRYDVMKDFSHVALLAQAQLLVASHPSLPTKTMQELIALAKRSPEKLTYASSGNGTTPHMLGALFTHATKLKIRHIPYKGGPQAWTAVISGEVDLIVGQVQQAIPLLKANRIRALAVFGGNRSSSLPKIPTFDEVGIKNLDVAVWYSIAVPSQVPEEIVSRLNKEINNALSDSGVKTKLEAGGLQILPSTALEATKFIGNEIPRWAEAVRISGARVD